MNVTIVKDKSNTRKKSMTNADKATSEIISSRLEDLVDICTAFPQTGKAGSVRPWGRPRSTALALKASMA